MTILTNLQFIEGKIYNVVTHLSNDMNHIETCVIARGL